MTTRDYLSREVIPAALSLLPPKMTSAEARAMLMAIALQESGCQHRRQINGPARGWFQFELGGVRDVMWHPAVRGYFADVMPTLGYAVAQDAQPVLEALEHNDILAAICARLLLWIDRDSLPAQDNPEKGWHIYKRRWRPGKPHPETWDAHFAAAWSL